jgi:hypothetical protein
MALPSAEFAALMHTFLDGINAALVRHRAERYAQTWKTKRARTMESTLEQRMKIMRQRWYDTLNAVDPDLFRRCVHAAEAVTLNHDLPLPVAAAIEWAVIGSVCDALGLNAAPPVPWTSPPKSEPNLRPSTLHAAPARPSYLSASPNPVMLPGKGALCSLCGNYAIFARACTSCGTKASTVEERP